jgi:hypothetical protein
MNGYNLRIIIAGALATLAVTAMPAAAAPKTSTVQVCNQATATSLGGNMTATDGDAGPAARYQDGLKAKPGNGVGLANAATHSKALSACSVPSDDLPSFDWDEIAS